jgi:hypothetical protein
MDLLSIPAKHPFLLLLLLSFSPSLSLEKISYIILRLLCNTKSLIALKCFQEKEAFKEARSGNKDDSLLAVATTTAKLTPKEDNRTNRHQKYLY